MNKMIIKMTDDFSKLPIKERPFDIPTIQYEKCGEFIASGKAYTVYRNRYTCMHEVIHETENHRVNKGYTITNPNGCFTLDDIKELF